ncbi:hypothetical protein JOF35_008841 [Streptomyces demainii]|uniref:Secreted protein n=1 Tax=Streptomyces demainii TaxID=588122 RepID=A0ABT9L702_9ACTN|nr:hypothetical protein [Streptomyces demainii]
MMHAHELFGQCVVVVVVIEAELAAVPEMLEQPGIGGGAAAHQHGHTRPVAFGTGHDLVSCQLQPDGDAARGVLVLRVDQGGRRLTRGPADTDSGVEIHDASRQEHGGGDRDGVAGAAGDVGQLHGTDCGHGHVLVPWGVTT